MNFAGIIKYLNHVKFTIPIGIQSFSEIREGGYIYIDKTEYIYRLIAEGKYYFLSRPRRFGKSLLLSTIEEYFKGNREFFNGLAISKHDHTWTNIPYCILICRVAQLIRTTVCPHLLRIFFYDGRMNMTYLQTMIYPIASDLRRLLSKRINRPAIR